MLMRLEATNSNDRVRGHAEVALDMSARHEQRSGRRARRAATAMFHGSSLRGARASTQLDRFRRVVFFASDSIRRTRQTRAGLLFRDQAVVSLVSRTRECVRWSDLAAV